MDKIRQQNISNGARTINTQKPKEPKTNQAVFRVTGCNMRNLPEAIISYSGMGEQCVNSADVPSNINRLGKINQYDNQTDLRT